MPEQPEFNFQEDVHTSSELNDREEISFFRMQLATALTDNREGVPIMTKMFFDKLHPTYALVADLLSNEDKEKFKVVAERVASVFIKRIDDFLTFLPTIMDQIGSFKVALEKANETMDKIDEMDRNGYLNSEQKEKIENQKKILKNIKIEVLG